LANFILLHEYPELSLSILVNLDAVSRIQQAGPTASGAVRGTPDDYDGWARDGCNGWSWNEVLPSFIRLERDLDCGDRAYHGRTGPIPIERTPTAEWGAVAKAFAEAALASGARWQDDINAPGARGVYPGARNTRNGVRVTTNDAYLEPAGTLKPNHLRRRNCRSS
jgi:choline dehydrogenase-like flavoprotein